MTFSYDDVTARLQEKIKRLMPDATVKILYGERHGLSILLPRTGMYRVQENLSRSEWHVDPFTMPRDVSPHVVERLYNVVAETIGSYDVDMVITNTFSGEMTATGARSKRFLDIREAFGDELTYEESTRFRFRGRTVSYDVEEGYWEMVYGGNHNSHLFDPSIVQAWVDPPSVKSIHEGIEQEAGAPWNKSKGVPVIRFAGREWHFMCRHHVFRHHIESELKLISLEVSKPDIPPMEARGSEQEALSRLRQQIREEKRRQRLRGLL